MDPSLFNFYAVGVPQIDANKIEAALVKEINLIQTKGVTPEELEKVKNKAKISIYRNLATINGKAGLIGDYEFYYGNYERLFTAIEEMDAVKPDDIKRVANQYLIRSNRTVGILSSRKDTKKGDL